MKKILLVTLPVVLILLFLIGVLIIQLFSNIFENRKTRLIISLVFGICLMRKMTDLSLPSIGKIFSRDHTTIISSLDNIETEIKESSLLEIEINELIKEITAL